MTSIFTGSCLCGAVSRIKLHGSVGCTYPLSQTAEDHSHDENTFLADDRGNHRQRNISHYVHAERPWRLNRHT